MCSAACRRTASSAPSRRSEALAAPPKLVALERQRRDTGFHFVDFLGREAKARRHRRASPRDSYTVHSTINATLQRETEAALQEGLARYEIEHGPRAVPWRRKRTLPTRSKSSAIEAARRAPRRRRAGPSRPGSRRSTNARLPLYDVHWEPAVILEKRQAQGGEALRVGLADGRILPLTTWSVAIAAQPQALRCRLRPGDRGQGEGQGDGSAARRAARAADGAGRGAGAGEQDRPHPRHGRQLLLSA